MQQIQNLHTINSNLDMTTRNNLFDENVKKMDNIKEELYISGLEYHMAFQDEFATNFLDDYLQNSKPEEKLNHLATAMCIEAYALNSFKKIHNINLNLLNRSTDLYNSESTSKLKSDYLIYNLDRLETTEGIAFIYHFYELVNFKKLPSYKDIEELKTVSANTENEEVRICAEWIINNVERQNEFFEFIKLDKSAKVAGSLIIYINKTLKMYPDFRTNCFGISQFRTNLINQMNEYWLDEQEILDKEILDSRLNRTSRIVEEFNHRA